MPSKVRQKLLYRLGQLLIRFGALTRAARSVLLDQFVGAVLLPEETIREELGFSRRKLSAAELGTMKKRYGISMEAIVRRAQACGIITRVYCHQYLSFMQRMDWVGHEPVAYQGVEESDRFSRLLFRGVIEGKNSVSRAAALSNRSMNEFLRYHLPTF